MSDLVGNPDCWFSHAKAQMFSFKFQEDLSDTWLGDICSSCLQSLEDTDGLCRV